MATKWVFCAKCVRFLLFPPVRDRWAGSLSSAAPIYMLCRVPVDDDSDDTRTDKDVTDGIEVENPLVGP